MSKKICTREDRGSELEALFSVGSQIGFVQVRMGLQFVALCNAIGPVPRRCMYILSENYCIGNKPVNV